MGKNTQGDTHLYKAIKNWVMAATRKENDLLDQQIRDGCAYCNNPMVENEKPMKGARIIIFAQGNRIGLCDKCATGFISNNEQTTRCIIESNKLKLQKD